MAEGKDQGSLWYRFSRLLPFKVRAVCRKMLLKFWVGEDDAEAVREILFEDWDPVGFAPLLPRDEYDHYIPAIVWLLRRRRGAGWLEAHLADVDRYWFVGDTPVEKARRTAENLIAC